MNNKIFSIPVILVSFFLFWPLGLVLSVSRTFIINEKWHNTIIYLLITAIICYIPSILVLFDINIFGHEVFKVFANTLVINSIVIALISAIANKIAVSLKNKINNAMQQKYEINKKNDLLIKEKQMRSKMTNTIECPNCGAVSIVNERTKICEYCRTVLLNKEEIK